MERLLSLPVELRLQIYKHVLCHEQLEIDVSEYWQEEDPKFWERFGRPLTQIDPDLVFDIHALHWSRITITYSEHMRHSIPTSDQKFVFWLFGHADMVRKVLGFLRFRNNNSYAWRCNRSFSECVDSVAIDFKTGDVYVLDGEQKACACEHASKIRSTMLTVLLKVRLGYGRLQPRLRDLWGLYEVWRLHCCPRDIPWARDWSNASLEYSHAFRCPNDPATKLLAAKGCYNDLHDLQQLLALSDSAFEYMVTYTRRTSRRHGNYYVPPERPYISSLLELDLWMSDSRGVHWENSYRRDCAAYYKSQNDSKCNDSSIIADIVTTSVHPQTNGWNSATSSPRRVCLAESLGPGLKASVHSVHSVHSPRS